MIVMRDAVITDYAGRCNVKNMKTFYIGLVILIFGVSVALAQTLPRVSVPGYSCVTTGSEATLIITCRKNTTREQVTRGVAGPAIPSINTPYARMMTQAARYGMFGGYGDPGNDMNRETICNLNAYQNITRACGRAANDAILRARDLCFREQNPNSCGMGDATNCCDALPQQAS